MAFKVSVDEKKKIFNAEVYGFPEANGAGEALKNYNKLLGNINPKEYSMILDCAELGVFRQESVPALQGLFKLYQQTGFKNIIFVNPKTVTSAMQLKRVAKSVPGFTGKFVNTKEEAEGLCG